MGLTKASAKASIDDAVSATRRPHLNETPVGCACLTIELVLLPSAMTPEIDSRLLSKLCDPVGGTPLRLVARDLVSAQGRAYPVRAGVAELMVPQEEMEREFGRRTIVAWQGLQSEAEASYATRIEGHFSVETYRPAIDYGEIVSQFFGEFLDVGCGRLPKPAYMKAAREVRFFGIDPMGVHVDQPREFPFARALGDFLPFRDASFDGVMFSSSLDHCISPLASLEHARRVLRPGGVLFVWETIRPDDEKMRAWMSNAIFNQSRYNERHNWGFTKPTLELVVSKAGFTSGTWYPTSAASEWVYVAFTSP